MANLRREIKQILERNKRVEADKAWETSIFRRVLIVIFTYFTIVLWLYMIKAPNIWFNAVIPALAFILSTLTLPFIKKWWIKAFYKK